MTSSLAQAIVAEHPGFRADALDAAAWGRLERLALASPLYGRVLQLRPETCFWLEEPRNLGARAHMFPRLMQIMPEEMHFGYVGRPERASPGEGYPAAHASEQNRIVTTAIDLHQPISQYPRKTPGER